MSDEAEIEKIEEWVRQEIAPSAYSWSDKEELLIPVAAHLIHKDRQAVRDAAPEWISIRSEEDLPLNEEVLVKLDNGYHIGEFSDHHHLHFNGVKWNYELPEILGWMRIPK